jgi:uncharacterized membrane protein
MTVTVHHIADVTITATTGEIIAALCGAALAIVAAAASILSISRLITSLRKPTP